MSMMGNSIARCPCRFLGDTEEEVEEYAEVFENLDQYRADAKKNRPLRKADDSDSDTDTDSDTDSDSDTDTDTDT